jgi:hypothetical protein
MGDVVDRLFEGDWVTEDEMSDDGYVGCEGAGGILWGHQLDELFAFTLFDVDLGEPVTEAIVVLDVGSQFDLREADESNGGGHVCFRPIEHPVVFRLYSWK